MKLDETKLTENEKVAKIVRDQVRGMINKDIPKLRAIISPKAKLYHITGMAQSRDQWLLEIEKGRMHYFNNEEVLFQVLIDGDKAQVISRNKLDARINGFRNTWPLQTMTNLQKIDGKWYIIQSRSSMY